MIPIAKTFDLPIQSKPRASGDDPSADFESADDVE